MALAPEGTLLVAAPVPVVEVNEDEMDDLVGPTAPASIQVSELCFYNEMMVPGIICSSLLLSGCDAHYEPYRV